MKKIENGDEVQHKVTKFKGIVMTELKHITGCIRYEVQPEGLKDGNSIEPQWLDNRMLKILKKKKVKIPDKPLEGPANTPPKFKAR